jgi:siroheme synthase
MQAVVNAGISGPSIIIVGEVVDIPRMSNAKA